MASINIQHIAGLTHDQHLPPHPSLRSYYYGSHPYAGVLQTLLLRHKVDAAAHALKAFSEGQYDVCRALCNEVINSWGDEGRPSEAIRARCHMLLAHDEVLPGYATVQVHHAATAVKLWNVIMERTGKSRYPIEEAQKALREARKLLTEALGRLAGSKWAGDAGEQS
jgi:hypothetical protein